MRFSLKAFHNFAVASLLLALLTACEAPISHPGVARPSSRVSHNDPTDPEPALAPTPETAPLVRADLIADPGRLQGLNGQQVIDLLGAPNFKRHEADAEIWQYYGPSSSCVLDLFVYPDLEQSRVAHVELRSRGLSAGAAENCLAQIVDGKRG